MSFPLSSLLKKFLTTIQYYCHGQGKPWRLILLWYFMLNIFSITAGFLITLGTAYLMDTTELIVHCLGVFVYLCVGILGCIILFIYPFIFTYALYRCAFNVKFKFIGYFNRFLILPFWIAHLYFGILYMAGSTILLGVSWGMLKKIAKQILN